MKILEVTDPEQVRVFRDIRKQWQTQLRAGKFYAEGEQVITRLLQSEVQVISLLITPEYLQRWNSLIGAKQNPEWIVQVAEKTWIEEATGQRLNQGCLAIGMVPKPPSLLNLRRTVRHCFVALDGIDHAVNVGGIARNCAAFGVTAILVDDKSVSPFSWRAIRTSLGGVFYVPVSAASSLIAQLRTLQNQEIELVAVDPHGDQGVSEFDFGKSCCFIFGSEHSGISDHILNLASTRVAISHSGKVDSLNVAAASAIILQRWHAARTS